MKLERFVALNDPAAAAATRALAQMTRPGAAVTLRNSRLISRAASRLAASGADEIVAAVYMTITGGLEGAALLCFSEPKARALGGLLLGREPGGSAPLTDADESALKELGNIVCGNYVTALSNQMRVKVLPGVPEFARGACGQIFEGIVARLDLDSRSALLIDVELEFPAGIVLGRLLLCFKTGREIEA